MWPWRVIRVCSDAAGRDHRPRRQRPGDLPPAHRAPARQPGPGTAQVTALQSKSTLLHLNMSWVTSTSQQRRVSGWFRDYSQIWRCQSQTEFILMKLCCFRTVTRWRESVCPHRSCPWSGVSSTVSPNRCSASQHRVTGRVWRLLSVFQVQLQTVSTGSTGLRCDHASDRQKPEPDICFHKRIFAVFNSAIYVFDGTFSDTQVEMHVYVNILM